MDCLGRYSVQEVYTLIKSVLVYLSVLIEVIV